MRSAARVQNTGKPSEEAFDKAWKTLGKRAHVFAFTDASKATGRNGRVVGIDAQPSDRLVTFAGVVHFAEVKSTHHEGRFTFSLLRPKQGSYAAQIITAGGPYFVYVHSLAHELWFKIPYQIIKLHKDLGQSSLTWDFLIENGYQWKLPSMT